MKNVEQKLVEIGCTVWEKYGRKRVYINSDEEIEKVFRPLGRSLQLRLDFLRFS